MHKENIKDSIDFKRGFYEDFFWGVGGMQIPCCHLPPNTHTQSGDGELIPAPVSEEMEAQGRVRDSVLNRADSKRHGQEADVSLHAQSSF